MTDTAKVTADILAGRHDGKLIQIIEAIQHRMSSGAAQTYWRIRWDDLEVTEQSITAGEMRTVIQYLSAARGQRVTVVDVHPELEPGDFIAVLATVLQSRKGVALKEAEKLIGDVPMADLLAAVDMYEVAPAPKD